MENKFSGCNLIFLISQPRAGSTLVQRILGSHSDIYTRSEPWIMLHALYTLKNNGIYTEYNVIWERKAFDNFVSNLPGGGREIYMNELRKMYSNLYNAYLSENNKKFFLDKTPRYYLIIDELLEVFFDAKYILLIRNPLAVLGSIIRSWTKNYWFNLSNYKYDLTLSIDKFINVIENKREKFYILFYEDLILNQDRSLKPLCEYLGIKFEDKMLNYYEVLKERWEFGDQENVYEKLGIEKNNIYKWQESLHDAQYWRTLYDYLTYLGKEKYEKLGYDYNENMDTLLENMPAENIENIRDKTVDLFLLLDDTRDYLIDNYRFKQQLMEKQDIIKKREQEIALKNTELKEKQETIVQKEKDLEALRGQLLQIQNIVQQRDREFSELSEKYRQLQQEIALKNTELKEKQETIVQKEKDLEALRGQLLQIQNIVQQRDREFSELSEKYRQLQRENNKVVAERDALLNSLSWKLTKPARSALKFIRGK